LMNRRGTEAAEPQGGTEWRKWVRRKPPPLDEIRRWWLTCDECEHEAAVTATLRRLRHAKLICSACGTVKVRRSQ
jgi:transcription elongation factor Elf1